MPVGCGFASGFGSVVLFWSRNFGANTVATSPTFPSTSVYFGSYFADSPSLTTKGTLSKWFAFIKTSLPESLVL